MLVRLALALLLLLSPALSRAAPPSAPAQVSACFVPGPASCAEEIVGAIDAARTTVLVQAYYLTSPPILHALAVAKKRGVDVRAILDKSQDRRESARSRYTGATYLANAGVPVWIDDAPAIAHNKIIVIDAHLVITGSFNFTKSADTRNAENVVMIESAEVAKCFGENWESRRAASRVLGAE
jgi:phospholipase D